MKSWVQAISKLTSLAHSTVYKHMQLEFPVREEAVAIGKKRKYLGS